MIIAIFKTILNPGICSEDWKDTRTILFSCLERDIPFYRRPITIITVMNIFIFCKIAQAFHKIHEDENINLSEEKKDSNLKEQDAKDMHQ